MRIVDTWKQNGNMFAYCVGKNINADFSCKKILSNDTEYDVENVDVQISFIGNISATLMLKEELYDQISPGEIEIIS